METYLDRILERTRLRIQDDIKERSFNDLERASEYLPAPRDFAAAMKLEGMSLIAEIKRQSPSAGPIRPDADAAKLAAQYEEGGATAVSVLTEPYFFSGSIEDLPAARDGARLPLLRKDFFLDPYQIVQARAAGADAILLIVSALPDRALFNEMANAARSFGLAALIEVHDPFELDLAFEAEPEVVGINQRNLMTFEVDSGLAAKLRREIPADVAAIAESGIKTRSDVQALDAAGVDGVLVGETLMRADEPARAVRELLGTTEQDDG